MPFSLSHHYTNTVKYFNNYGGIYSIFNLLFETYDTPLTLKLKHNSTK